MTCSLVDETLIRNIYIGIKCIIITIHEHIGCFRSLVCIPHNIDNSHTAKSTYTANKNKLIYPKMLYRCNKLMIVCIEHHSYNVLFLSVNIDKSSATFLSTFTHHCVLIEYRCFLLNLLISYVADVGSCSFKLQYIQHVAEDIKYTTYLYQTREERNGGLCILSISKTKWDIF